LHNQIIVGAGSAKDYEQYYNLTSKPALTGFMAISSDLIDITSLSLD
jgi:hypothetical protein